jgi:transcriptional regulator with XRE-family HTH domain
MDAKTTLGRFVRHLREQQNLTQEQLATRTGITYQYLSGVENGRENFSIDVLEALGIALKCPLPALVTGAFAPQPVRTAGKSTAVYRKGVPLPPGLDLEQLRKVIASTEGIVAAINQNLSASGGKPLANYVQGNNFSGLVSNILTDAFHEHSVYKHNSHQAYPDLLGPAKGRITPGLEVKTTVQIGKGGESHNGHSGWHLIACYKIEAETGNIRFIHLMFAVLNGHQHDKPDWTYVGSKVNAATGSRRTETYNTTLTGTTKLRDGTAMIDPPEVDYSRWRQQREGPVPDYSIFA